MYAERRRVRGADAASCGRATRCFLRGPPAQIDVHVPASDRHEHLPLASARVRGCRQNTSRAVPRRSQRRGGKKRVSTPKSNEVGRNSNIEIAWSGCRDAFHATRCWVRGVGVGSRDRAAGCFFPGGARNLRRTVRAATDHWHLSPALV